MACPPPRSRSASRAGKRSNKSRKSSNSLFARLLRPLVGKTAIAAYSAAAAAGSFLLAPQLEGARHWARDNALHWLQTQPLVRDASHWLEDQQDQWAGWQEDLLTLARQSRESAHPSSGGNKASQPPPPKEQANNKPANASGSFAQCAEQLPASAPLGLASVGASWMPVALCSDGFAVLYSGLSKTPIVTIERLNRNRLQHAAGQERTDHFYPDARLRATYKANLTDYQDSGYDRGHMAAAANQSTETGMAQSFALSNMVPQDPTNNRKIWSKLEGDVRKYAKRAGGNVFVYTGPLFESGAHTIGRNQVWVPSHLYKLVFDEQQQRAWAWVLPNDASATLGPPMSYASFVKRTGRNFLPQLQRTDTNSSSAPKRNCTDQSLSIQ